MSTSQPLTDAERTLLDEYRADHPRELPWQFSFKWLLWLTTCVALLAALVARTNTAVGVFLLLVIGTAVTTRRLSRQRRQAMREIDEQFERESDAQASLIQRLEQSRDPHIRKLLASFTDEDATSKLYAAWLGTIAAGTLYPPLMVGLTVLVEGRSYRAISAAACSAVGGFLLTSFLAALVMVAVGLLLKLSGFRGSRFAVGSLVGGGTGLISIGLLYAGLAKGNQEYYWATAVAVLLGQALAVWAVHKAGNQKTHRIFKPKSIDQPHSFRLRQLFMLTTIAAVVSLLVAQLGLSEAQKSACLVGAGWLGVTIIAEQVLTGNARST